MNTPHRFADIPSSRLATFDVYAAGLKKHHVAALLEFDVTEGRKKLRELRKSGVAVSTNAWLIRVIAVALARHPEAAAFVYSRKKLILFDDINISMLVEKEVGGARVPLPLLIARANEKSAPEITREIEEAVNRSLTEKDIVLHRRPRLHEWIYYRLPGFLRRMVWSYLLSHPKTAYANMGNAVVTSLGMIGQINGWFIPKSVHPVSFGIGSVLKKPMAVNDEIRIREVLHMTVLIDHDVIDGAPMVRLLNDLRVCLESGWELDGRTGTQASG
jgi:pyruvate/2-oxoglutarate dehydrogenase complex dihydrolipoamide acyltransferase (E2) component